MANHGIVRLDKLQAVYAGNIESIQATVDLDNGSVVAIGGLVANAGGEVVEASAPTDVATQEVLLVASPELLYDPQREGLGDFYNKANKPARAYHFTVGDIVTVTDNMINGTSVVGQYLVPENGSVKLVPAADLSGGTRFAAVVIAKEKVYGEDCTVYRVVKC